MSNRQKQNETAAAGSLYGYARVSTATQKLQRQINNLREAYPGIVIYSDKWTGTTENRPEWMKLRRIAETELERGKPVTLVFDSVSRLSRNAEEGYAIYRDLCEKGAELIFLNEPYLNTAVYRKSKSEAIPCVGNEIADLYIEATNKVLLLLAEKQIRIAFEQSEKEVADLRKRTSEALKVARAAGKQVGGVKGKTLNVKKKEPVKSEIRRLSRAFDGILTDKECIRQLGIAPNTFYKYKAELKAGE